MEEAPLIDGDAARDRVAGFLPPGLDLAAPEAAEGSGALAMLKKAFTTVSPLALTSKARRGRQAPPGRQGERAGAS